MVRRSTFPAYLAAVLFAVGCSESAGPGIWNQSPGTPFFSYSPSGITLNRDILTFNQSGTLLIKGFDPTSPHNGDAVIATFYWLGSTNIIDSVVDVMTTAPYTPVGNTYHLVKYVTADGLSMATYVATNIQNFPDGASHPNPVYAVGAYLRQPVTDGGIRLTAWTGVEDVFAQAIGTGAGAPRSASGSGTVPTVASAGSIAYNAGAIIYAATVAKPPVGVDRDPTFVSVSGGADGFMKDDAVYSVRASSGTANPQWTWYFDQQPGGGTWLLTSLTLNVAPPPPPPPAFYIAGPVDVSWDPQCRPMYQLVDEAGLGKPDYVWETSGQVYWHDRTWAQMIFPIAGPNWVRYITWNLNETDTLFKDDIWVSQGGMECN